MLAKLKGTDVDTITDSEPFNSGTKIPTTPQEHATYDAPVTSTSALAEGRKMFGADGGNSFLPPYLMLDYKKTPILQPTSLNSQKNGIPLSTPADMDGHFLQKFDDALLRYRNTSGGKQLLRDFF